eukprot:CAMPEP_0203874866 /NCGR_PEP_ID=MMETSP0359-20131031/20512_1 /ASSEMBLY_ACC=CAM_ASM_000338 /TAXON_ID=268821 /ORGANISM="Scrippsiella Hangoei, Strain SHTV-5" /LENGTH=367 /DNA_ID=CAMNT_0050793651 /DNA_START=79 /DNA_END=1182 /DNA_ORIENTATION=-
MDLGELLKKSVVELQSLCADHDLNGSGTNVELAQRLLLHDFTSTKRKREDAASSSAPPSTLEEDIRSKLDCPICFEVMVPPIKQCREGHPFCSACCSSLFNAGRPKCPTCRCALAKPVARALQLEQVASSLRLKCKWELCAESCTYGDYVRHSRTCDKRPLDCPIEGATCWSGSVGGLCDHMGQTHNICKQLAARHVEGTRTFECKWLLGFKDAFPVSREKRTVFLRIGAVDGITPSCTFVLRLWCSGSHSPFMLAVQQLERNKPGHSPQWKFIARLESPEDSLTWTSFVRDLETASDVWCSSKRKLHECVGKVMIIHQKQVEASCVEPDLSDRRGDEGQVFKMGFVFEKLVEKVDLREGASAEPPS